MIWLLAVIALASWWGFLAWRQSVRVLELERKLGLSPEAIELEWHRTVAALAQITGEKHLLAGNAALQRSIRHRFPYIDPLNHLQVELIRRYREGKADERVQRGIHISINGIAAGLRNTG